MDDPLSAVDVKVGQHIFEQRILGLLGQKTRVLTSHQEQHMKKADNVILLYQGRVLGKGTFTELKDEGIVSTTVDPLLTRTLTENEFDETLLAEGKDGGFSDSGGHNGLSNSQAKSVVIPQEDRTIGVVSSKLYWDYFRSGMHVLVILAGTVFCFVIQGWLSFIKSLCSYNKTFNLVKCIRVF